SCGASPRSTCGGTPRCRGWGCSPASRSWGSRRRCSCRDGASGCVSDPRRAVAWCRSPRSRAATTPVCSASSIASWPPWRPTRAGGARRRPRRGRREGHRRRGVRLRTGRPGTMGEISTVLVLGSLVAYTVALISFAVDISALGGHAPHRTVRRAANIAVAVSWLGFGMHAVGLVLRGLAAGRVPWANMYEFSLTFGIVAMGTFLVINRVRDIRYLGVFVSFIVVCVLTVAFWQLYVEADGVQPILDSYWLGIHVSVAAASTGLFSVAAAASALQLLQHRQERKVEARAAVAAPVPVAAGAVGTLETVELDTVDTAESVETSGAGSAGGTSPRR